MLKRIRQTLSGLVCLLLGGGGLWFCSTGTLEAELDSLPDYDYLAEIRQLEKDGRLGEAEHLANWVLAGSDVAARDEVEKLRDEIHEKRTSFWNRTYRAGKGFLVGGGTSVEELGGSIVSDFLLWGDVRDLAKQGWNKIRGREADPVVAALAAVGVVTSVASYIPEPGEAAEVSADASLSLLKTLRKTGHLSKKFCRVLVAGCRESVKAKSLSKGMKDVVVGMKGLFDGAGAARAAAIMKHVDDIDSLKAVSKVSKAAAEPAAVLVRALGAEGVKTLRSLAEAEGGVEALEKAARKGPSGLKRLVRYPKSLLFVRTAKSGWLHGRNLLRAVKQWVLEKQRVPVALLSGLLALVGLGKLKVWRIAKIRRLFRGKKKKDPAQ